MAAQEKMNRALAWNYDRELLTYKRASFVIGGGTVYVPKPPSKYYQVLRHETLLAPYEVDLLDNRNGGIASYKQIIRDIVLDLQERQMMIYDANSQLIFVDGQPLQVIWSFDGALGHKGQKLVSWTFRVMPALGASNSLRQLKQFILFEGGDSNPSLHYHLGDKLDKLNKFVKKGTLSFGDQLQESVPLTHSLVADAHGLRDNFGLNDGCPFCECPKEKFFHFQEKIEYPERTLERLELLAHLVPGHCPGCNVDIVTPAQYKQEIDDANATFRKPKAMFLVAKQGDELPQSYLSTLKQLGLHGTWLEIHKQVVYATKIVLRIEPRDCYCCLLHGDMRIVGMLTDACLWKTLSTFHQKKSGYSTETICEQIYNLLRKHGIQVSKVEAASNSPGAWWSSLCTHSFSGRDCNTLVSIIFIILDLVFPAHVREKDAQTQQQYSKWCELWRYYITEIRELLDRRWCQPEPTDYIGEHFDNTAAERQHRIDKAEQIEIKMPIFMKMYVDCYKATTHLYCHIYWYHLVYQLRNHRVEPADAQMQSVENNNKKNKTRQNRTSNHHKEHNQQQQVRGTHGKADYVRNSGPCRTVQVLNQSLLQHTLHEQGLNPQQESKQEAGRKQQVLAQANQMRIDKTVAGWM